MIFARIFPLPSTAHVTKSRLRCRKCHVGPTRKPAPTLQGRLLLLPLALLPLFLFLGGCSPGSPQARSTPTYFLAEDGTIIGGPTNPAQRTDPGRRARQNATILPPEPFWRWEGDGVPGKPSILIRLDEQKAYFKRDGRIVGVTEISTGREGYRTPAGKFRVTQKSRNHVSNLYGNYVDPEGNVVMENVGVRRDPKPPGTTFRGAPMPFFLRINGAVGMHAGYLPGFPASHGCIRLPHGAAEKFFANAPEGTPVVVSY